jgi:hypothetical protein
VSVSYCLSRSSFEQRLFYERLLGKSVPRSARRDLKDAFYLQLDANERFPRLSIRHGSPSVGPLYGPFRTRGMIDVALRELHKRFPLRPCDYVFEPRVDLPLGLGCLYAQTRTCSAPCLLRMGEVEYRALAAEAAAFLLEPGRRGELPWIAPFVSLSQGISGVVVIPEVEEVALYPVSEWSVLDERVEKTPPRGIREAVSRLSFERGPQTPDDSPWLTEWLYSRKREGAFLIRRPGMAFEETIVRLAQSS